MMNKRTHTNPAIHWIFFDVGSTLVDEEEAYKHRIIDMIQGTSVTFEQFSDKRIQFAKEGYNGDQKGVGTAHIREVLSMIGCTGGICMTFLDTSDLKNEEITLRLDHTFPGDPVRSWVPAYYFDILDATGQKVGICDLRIGHNEGLYYGGNIGYAVDEPFRGNHYAEKACRLLFELARRHEMDYLIISCQPTNLPSRRTCERLGGKLLEIAELPPDNDMRINDGHTHECIFRFDL